VSVIGESEEVVDVESDDSVEESVGVFDVVESDDVVGESEAVFDVVESDAVGESEEVVDTVEFDNAFVEILFSSTDEEGSFALYCIVRFGHSSLKQELNMYLFDLTAF